MSVRALRHAPWERQKSSQSALSCSPNRRISALNRKLLTLSANHRKTKIKQAGSSSDVTVGRSLFSVWTDQWVFASLSSDWQVNTSKALNRPYGPNVWEQLWYKTGNNQKVHKSFTFPNGCVSESVKILHVWSSKTHIKKIESTQWDFTLRSNW